MEKIIYLNAGHSEEDPGALSKHGVERDLNIVVRDLVVPLLEAQGFEVREVPDNLRLLPSILWVNTRAIKLNDGLAFAIHQNDNGGEGAESYYYKQSRTSKLIAQRLIDAYCETTGLRNRGAKSSSNTRWGRLGWIEDTNCWATLIECGFMDNDRDMNFIIENFDKVAEGIARGICAIYGIVYKELEPEPDPPAESIIEMNQKSLALKEIVEILKKYEIIC